MKLVYTEQALVSLEESLEFIAPKVTHEKLIEIRDRILDTADTLLLQPLKGQKEPQLEHLDLDHRRIIESHYKIIYRVVGEYIYITDIFDVITSYSIHYTKLYESSAGWHGGGRNVPFRAPARRQNLQHRRGIS